MAEFVFDPWPNLSPYVRIEALSLLPKERHLLARGLALTYIFTAHRGDEALQEAIEGTVDRFLARRPGAVCRHEGVGL